MEKEQNARDSFTPALTRKSDKMMQAQTHRDQWITAIDLKRASDSPARPCLPGIIHWRASGVLPVNFYAIIANIAIIDALQG